MGNHGAGVCRRPGHPEEKSRGFWRLAETAAEGGQKPSRMYLENSIQKRDGKEKSFQEKKISSISTSEKQTSKKEAGMHAGKHAGRREQERCNAMQQERPSKKGRRADALALRADERRDKLRKAAGRGKCPVIRRCLNGETRMGRIPCIHARIHNAWRGTRRTETSK